MCNIRRKKQQQQNNLQALNFIMATSQIFSLFKGYKILNLFHMKFKKFVLWQIQDHFHGNKPYCFYRTHENSQIYM